MKKQSRLWVKKKIKEERISEEDQELTGSGLSQCLENPTKEQVKPVTGEPPEIQEEELGTAILDMSERASSTTCVFSEVRVELLHDANKKTNVFGRLG